MTDIHHKLDRPVPPGHYVVRVRAVLPRIGPRGLSMQMELEVTDEQPEPLPTKPMKTLDKRSDV